ncbi:hypothetical protein Bca4012_032143 [Brassica carinata]
MALWKLQWFICSDELRFLEASIALWHVKNDGSVSYFCFMFCFNVSMWHVKFVCFSIHVYVKGRVIVCCMFPVVVLFW